MKRAPNEKECRARTLSHLRHNSRSSSGSSGSKVAHLQQPNTARDTGSRKAETRSNQKKRHRPGRNNFGALTPAAPERETPEPLLFNDKCGEIYAKRSELGCDGRMNHGHVVECGAVAPLLIRCANRNIVFYASPSTLSLHAADSPVATRTYASTLKPRYLLRHGRDLS